MNFKTCFGFIVLVVLAIPAFAQDEPTDQQTVLDDAVLIYEMKMSGDPEIGRQLGTLYNNWSNPDQAVMGEMKQLFMALPPQKDGDGGDDSGNGGGKADHRGGAGSQKPPGPDWTDMSQEQLEAVQARVEAAGLPALLQQSYVIEGTGLTEAQQQAIRQMQDRANQARADVVRRLAESGETFTLDAVREGMGRIREAVDTKTREMLTESQQERLDAIIADPVRVISRGEVVSPRRVIPQEDGAYEYQREQREIPTERHGTGAFPRGPSSENP